MREKHRDAQNTSEERDNWQKSNERVDAIRELDGASPTGARGHVINSVTWDPTNHTREGDVEHVDVSTLRGIQRKENQTLEQRIKFQEENYGTNTNRTPKGV